MPDTLVDRLTAHARDIPDKPAVRFIRHQRDGRVIDQLSYAELDGRARAIARELRKSLVPGDRAVLLYPSGPDFAAAFAGCLYAGVIAVPAPLPTSIGQQGPRTIGIVRDADAELVLTGSAQRSAVAELLDGSAPVLAVDAAGESVVDEPVEAAGPHTVALLQYTSGSTSEPKGVVVPHGALTHNFELIQRSLRVDAHTRPLSWLPHYHDMGLIGMLLSPLHYGVTATLLSPTDFLRHPQVWLELISEHRITLTTAPNFAYELCARRLTDEQIGKLDLSSLRVALNGAEPVRADTIIEFTQRFAPAGLRPSALKPCYGMAETTLFVSSTPAEDSAVITRVDRALLEKHEFRPVDDPDAPLLTSSGRVDDLDVRIVDPESGQELGDGQVGEIWVRGASVTAGYWRAPEATERVFHAVTADGAAGFLRTGDLGVFAAEQLYVTGRIKDMLIVNGRNLYPHDIERELATLHEAFLGLRGSVCAVPAGPEQIVVLQELRARGREPLDLPALARKVRGELSSRFGVKIGNLVFLRPGQVLTTTSGKVRRAAMREKFVAGTLDALHEDLDAATRGRYRPALAGERG